MNKLPYGSMASIAHRCGVTEQYVNRVLRGYHSGELIVRTEKQRAVVRAYKRMVRKYAPKRGIVITKTE